MLSKHSFLQPVLPLAVLFFTAVSGWGQTQSIKTLKLDDGSASSTYNADAIVDMQSNRKGLLLPRVALTATNSPSPLSTFAAGMAVYNTATAGSGATAVAPGYYFCDGYRWVKSITQATDQTVDVTGLTTGLTSPNSFTGATFSPNTPASADYIYINDADGTTWTYDATSSSYKQYNAPASTEWYLANGTTDAGSNKTSAIYRNGSVYIGTNTSLTGGANAKLQINSATNGAIQIQDGTQKDGYVLTSDANGLCTWQKTQTSAAMYSGTSNYTRTYLNTTAGSFTDINESITLPPGTYVITYDCQMASNTLNSAAHIALSATMPTAIDAPAIPMLNANAIGGTIAWMKTLTSTTTLKLWMFNNNYPGGTWIWPGTAGTAGDRPCVFYALKLN